MTASSTQTAETFLLLFYFKMWLFSKMTKEQNKKKTEIEKGSDISEKILWPATLCDVRENTFEGTLHVPTTLLEAELQNQKKPSAVDGAG